MCYAKPGPRCTPHAKKLLDKAVAEAVEEQTFTTFEAMKHAQEDYDRTPGGQAELREKIDQETDERKRRKFEDRLEYGIESRRLALDEIKARDHGDVNVDDDNMHAERTPEEERNYTLIQSMASPSVEPQFPGALAVDPEGCGCTECIVGEYVPEERFILSASSADLRDFASGKLGNNTYGHVKDVFENISYRARIDDDIKHALKVWDQVDSDWVTH